MRLLFLVLGLVALTAAAETYVDFPVTRTMPALNLETNSVEASTEAPFFDYTWQNVDTAYTGSYSLSDTGCRTVVGIVPGTHLDIKARRDECNGVEKIKWIVSRAVEGQPGLCLTDTDHKLFEVSMSARINNLAQNAPSGDYLYESFPKTLDVLAPAANDEVMEFIRAAMNCPSVDPAWTAMVTAHTSERISLMRAPFLHCNSSATHTGAYMMQLHPESVIGTTRTYVRNSEQWTISEAGVWSANFKDAVAGQLGYTDMASFDAALTTLNNLPNGALLTGYVSMPFGSSISCTAFANKALVYMSIGKVKSTSAAPAVFSDLGSCDSMAFNPTPTTFAAVVAGNPIPDAASWSSWTQSTTVPGYYYPLNSKSPISSVEKVARMYDGKIRHFLRYVEHSLLTKRGNCTDGNGGTVLTRDTDGPVQEYIYTDDVVAIPASGSSMPYTYQRLTYRFTVNRDTNTYSVAQVYATETVSSELLQQEIVPCSPIEVGGNWTVPWKMHLRVKLTVDQVSTEVIGARTVKAAYDPLDVASASMPASGCYGFPSADQTLDAPTCADGQCSTEVDLYSQCYYPNAVGSTFYEECPNVACDPSIYQSSLGEFRFGVILRSCATVGGWASCSDLNPDDPRTVTYRITMDQPPLPDSRTLPHQVTPFRLTSANDALGSAITTDAADSFTTAGHVRQTYRRTDTLVLGARLSASLMDYLQLGVKQLAFCYMAVSRAREIIENPPENYDCMTDSASTIKKIVWENGVNPSTCASAPCFEAGDVAFKGTSYVPNDMPACLGIPGCDVGAMRISRIVSDAVMTTGVLQTETVQQFAILLQMTSSIGNLIRVQSTPPPTPLRSLSVRQLFRVPTLQATQIEFRVNDTAVFVITATDEPIIINNNERAAWTSSDYAWIGIAVGCVVLLGILFAITSKCKCAQGSDKGKYDQLSQTPKDAAAAHP